MPRTKVYAEPGCPTLTAAPRCPAHTAAPWASSTRRARLPSNWSPSAPTRWRDLPALRSTGHRGRPHQRRRQSPPQQPPSHLHDLPPSQVVVRGWQRTPPMTTTLGVGVASPPHPPQPRPHRSASRWSVRSKTSPTPTTPPPLPPPPVAPEALGGHGPYGSGPPPPPREGGAPKVRDLTRRESQPSPEKSPPRSGGPQPPRISVGGEDPGDCWLSHVPACPTIGPPRAPCACGAGALIAAYRLTRTNRPPTVGR